MQKEAGKGNDGTNWLREVSFFAGMKITITTTHTSNGGHIKEINYPGIQRTNQPERVARSECQDDT